MEVRPPGQPAPPWSWNDDQKSFYIETPEDVAERIRTALKYVPAEKLWINPDCGLNPTPRWIALPKLKSMVEGTKIVRRELGFKE